ncbi:hypothetical protein L596_029203 [Steinernema carpocapsae]|uniref:Hepatocyte growth factor-regulated tyrosine kinase substrate helical domain-containing protein n=1 Tax=Steinernema carpocapsae TaxID=34508 RepID=A0A4U5LTY1_STECR|nr:hypothetical protein L596_029203 [Steinernema carpocapsae]
MNDVCFSQPRSFFRIDDLETGRTNRGTMKWLRSNKEEKKMERKRQEEQARAEDDDLAMAILLSKMEAEEAAKKPSGSFDDLDQPSISGLSCMDARFLSEDYWAQKAKEIEKLGRTPSEITYSPSVAMVPATPTESNVEEKPAEEEKENSEVEETKKFCDSLEFQVTSMENRIRSNLSRGRSILGDSSLQSTFVRLAELHADVIRRMAELDDKREFYEQLQDKVTLCADSRAAVNALREDYNRQNRERIMAEQQARQREIQGRLQAMRYKKQVGLVSPKPCLMSPLEEMLFHQRNFAMQQDQMPSTSAMQQMPYVPMTPCSAMMPPEIPSTSGMTQMPQTPYPQQLSM